MWILIVLFIAFAVLTVYACCVAASKDSREIEREEIRFYIKDNKKN